jgi:hypothetical protein
MERHPRLGRMILAAARVPQHERWATGGDGEEILARLLERRCPNVRFLHDRQLPRSRANIDHLAIAPTGVWVIDTKRYTGKIDVVKPLFGTAKLMIGGRDRTKLIDGLSRQAGTVREAVQEIAPGVAVRGCLCFVAPEGLLADSGLPVLRTLSIGGYPLLYPRRLAKRLNEQGDLSAGLAQTIEAQVADRFPAAG